jgi:hypothetical protein
MRFPSALRASKSHNSWISFRGALHRNRFPITDGGGVDLGSLWRKVESRIHIYGQFEKFDFSDSRIPMQDFFEATASDGEIGDLIHESF